MEISKFPVSSKTRDYIVEISDEGYLWDSITAVIKCKSIITTKILKREKVIEEQLSKKTYLNCANEKKQYQLYKNNFKQFAIDAVKEYEEWLEQCKKDRQAKLDAIEDFNNWDGKCE